jgi:hypothetical protein
MTMNEPGYSPRLSYVLPGEDGETVSPSPSEALIPPVGSRVTFAPNAPSNHEVSKYTVGSVRVELRRYPSNDKTIQITYVYLEEPAPEIESLEHCNRIHPGKIAAEAMRDEVIICVTGGRDYRPNVAEEAEFARLWKQLGGTKLRHGACCDRNGNLIGVDAWAQRFAVMHEIDFEGMPARWRTGSAGKGEGPIRNRKMADREPHPIALIALRGGTGTADCVKAFESVGIPVYKIGGS